MIAFILGCEVAFWVVLALGLFARYVLHRPRLGIVLLICVPLVDVALLVATALHLRAGATADWSHGLAALYLGFSVAYGHYMVAWADRWAAYRFAGGPRPVKLYGRDHAVWAARDLARAVLAGAIAAGLLWLGIWFVDDPARTAALTSWFGSIALIVGIVAVVDGSDILWPRKPKARV